MSDKKTAGIDPELVRELAKILGDSGLSEIEVEHGEVRLRLARTVSVAAAPVTAPVHQVIHAAPAAAPIEAPTAAAPQSAASHPGMVPSPMVGTAYTAGEPGAPAFVKKGSSVKEGDTLVIIEAMKVMNPIKAHRAGTVTQILVENAQPVEYGDVLMVIE